MGHSLRAMATAAATLMLVVMTVAIVGLGAFVVPWMIEVWSVFLNHPITPNPWICLLVLGLVTVVTRSPLMMVAAWGVVTLICRLLGLV